MILQFVTGFGILSSFKLNVKPWMAIALSILLGVALTALVLLIPIFLRLDLNGGVFAVVLTITALLSNITSFRTKFGNYKNLFTSGLFKRIKLAEIPAILFIAFLFFISAWRCYYYPSYSRDLLSGPEVIAEYAVREHKIDNSLFTVNMESTNNQFKSPFIITLQMLYKFAGFKFGQVWLISIVLGFLMFLYQALARNIHPVLAGVLLFWFMCIPEMYAYSFMILFDYSNAVYFSVAVYLLLDHGREGNRYIFLSAIFFALATYIRTETLVLIPFLGAFYFISALWSKKDTWANVLKQVAIIMVPSVLIYFITGSFYLNNYIPQEYDISGLMNKNLGDLSPFFTRFSEIFNEMLFGEKGAMYFGNFFYLFIIIAIADLILYFYYKSIKNVPDYNGFRWVLASFMLLVGIAFLGYILPLMDLDHTTKRALFKFFPLLLLYFGHSILLRKVTQKLSY
ncbi:hypothetical protein [Taibaiella sp. KBW10]|uniref:hypothetical protein n=1 Tax=Taibaiella sp. KBW10 TaxID=2153357 RepID=UPI000F5AA9E0|nr:hypothetical protein [Taibaiella sp. KBW10]